MKAAGRDGFGRAAPEPGTVVASAAAPLPAAYVGPRHRWRVAWLAERLLAALARATADGPRSERPTVLDLGCGHGHLSLLLAARGLEVLAIDRSPRRLAHLAEQARSQGLAGHIHLCRADAQAPPLKAACLDGATCGEVLEHLDDDLACLRALAAALRPGAPLLATVPAGARRLTDIDRRAGHWRRYGGAQLVGRARAAGLVVLALLPWGFPFGRIYDRLVQGPALRTRAPAVRRLWAGLAGLRVVDAFWRALFRLDLGLGRLAPEAGSGWLLEAEAGAGAQAGEAGAQAGEAAPSRKA